MAILRNRCTPVLRTLGIAAILALPGVALAQVGSGQSSTECCWRECLAGLVVTGTYRLPGDEAFCCVDVRRGGELYTEGHTLKVTCAGGLTVDGILHVDGSGGKLELVAASTGANAHTIDGTIEIASGALIDVQKSTDFEGTGQIVGQGSAAKIQIAAGNFKLTNELATAGEGIRGQLQIVKASGLGANPTFMNKGIVEARGGTLEFTSAVALSDSSAAEFRVDNSGTLKFSRSATSLAGDFIVVSGEIDFVQSVTTSGALDYTDLNTITIASSKAFQYGSYAAGSDCDDLHDTTSDDDFIINTTKNACP